MREAAIYEQKDLRIFAVGLVHPGHAEAMRVLTDGGLVERDNPLGFKLPDRGEEAWKLFAAYPGLDPAWRRDVGARLMRLVRIGDQPVWVNITRPVTERDAVALAEAPQAMQQAEARVRELYARLAPWGGGACPPIWWRALDNPLGMSEPADRTALADVESLLVSTCGRHTYHARLYAAGQAMHPWSGTIHGTYAWAVNDYGNALVFDEVRSQLGGHDSPWESLLAINLLGFQVNVLAPDRVILAVRW